MMRQDQSVERGGDERRSTTMMSVAVVVLVWWLVIGLVIALTLPTAVASAPKPSVLDAGDPIYSVYLPGLSQRQTPFPVFTERAAFDLAQRGFAESNAGLIEVAFLSHEWITVTHGQPVRLVSRGGNALEVELLNGPHAGRRGWLKSQQVTRRSSNTRPPSVGSTKRVIGCPGAGTSDVQK